MAESAGCSRLTSRQKLARGFGATDIVAERGEDGVARIKNLTGGLGAHSVIEAVGTQESMMQARLTTTRGTVPAGQPTPDWVGYRRRLRVYPTTVIDVCPAVMSSTVMLVMPPGGRAPDAGHLLLLTSAAAM